MNELLGHPKNQKNAKGKPAPKTSMKVMKLNLGLPAYPWSDNSCWLDAPLQVIYMAVTKDFKAFETVFRPLDPDFALGALYSIFQDRFLLDREEENMSAMLGSQRDTLRIFLHKKHIIRSLNTPESAVVSPEHFQFF